MADLFSPLTLRGLTLRNRIAVSPMQQYSSPDGLVGDWHMVHLGSRAVGGAGLIIAESTAVRPDGRATVQDTGIWTDAQAESWRPIVRFVQVQGAKIALQLGHFGAKGSRAHPTMGFGYLLPEQGGWQTISSCDTVPQEGAPVPRALSIEEIKEVQQDFVAAARRAVAVGFDSVEIHAAHGYLFHQFYSALVNKRTDAYGGDFDGRTRMLRETVAAIRAEIPEDMPLLVRISAVDYIDHPLAWRLEDSVRLAAELKALGVDLLTASGGGFAFVSPDKVKPGYQVPFAEAIRQETGLATGAVGAITEAIQAQQIIAQGQADLVVMAKEMLRNPYFALRAGIILDQPVDIPTPYRRGF